MSKTSNMKYIRAKDGIYELMPNIEQDCEVSFDNKTIEPAYYTINTDWVAKKDVIKQADTIEELCDEFVIVGKKKNKIKEITKVIYSKRQLINNVIYGAIWTDKGLIYVAKMNEKGELELL